MVINENNSHINSFVKGMNSDNAYDQIENSQYTYGKNIRITKNQMLGGYTDYSTLHEGIVAPVPKGSLIYVQNQNAYKRNGEQTILAINSVDDICTIVTNAGNSLIVYRLIMNNDVVEEFKQIYKFDDFWTGDSHQLSAVLYKELENVIKLYIASGKYPIITLRVDDDGINSNGTIDDFINNRVVPQSPICINEVISGRLPASQVQYTYRFYNKHGNTSQLSPLTNKIQIIDSSRDKETGNAQGTETAKGLSISIDVSNYIDKFDRIQVYRLTYIDPKENSEVSLIYDDKIKNNAGLFVLNDVGIDPLQSLTMEEFAAMSGLIINPQIIQNNQQYMFCANVVDETIIKDAAIEDRDDYIDLVKTDVILFEQKDSNETQRIPAIPTSKFDDTNIITSVEDGQEIQTVSKYFQNRHIKPELPYSTYNDIFTSSLLRSLRRGETYKYAIIYYDKYGRRTDVIPIGSKNVDDISLQKEWTLPFVKNEDGVVFAQPIGVKINLPQPIDKTGNIINGITGCQIIRRSSSELYQKTLLQVALAKPVRQRLLALNSTTSESNDPASMQILSQKNSPFYPTGFLTAQNITIMPTYYVDFTENSVDGYIHMENGADPDLNAHTEDNGLFQIFSSEIDYRRDDVLERLNVSNTKLKQCLNVSAEYSGVSKIELDGRNNGLGAIDWEYKLRFFGVLFGDNDRWQSEYHNTDGITFHKDQTCRLSPNAKESVNWVFRYFDIINSEITAEENTIKSIKDVVIPNWNDGFTNVQRNEDNSIIDAIKKYRSFTTTIDKYTYNNWVSSCKYDLKPGRSGSISNQTLDYDTVAEFLDSTKSLDLWLNSSSNIPFTLDYADEDHDFVRNGYIGPGSSCFVISAENNLPVIPYDGIYTSICNIQHSPKTEDVESNEQTTYYGFGNYFNLQYVDGAYKINGTDTYAVVFDGDIYITPHELTTMYKTYHFESPDTLQSTQIVNYIPLESKVNTYFDYGNNLRNTNSSNLMYEPGTIEGVNTQERPAHQYNMIYSDNDVSNDVFTLVVTDKDDTNEFKQRAYFSEPKSNGEYIDNYLIYKPASFIDVDSAYGQITNLLTDKNLLYYWQDHAFGKFSVNERSLINDQNGNTIMLGQAGVLSRFDYISTKFGMRNYDFCATSAENGVYWVDVNNKAVVAANGNQAVNFGEQLGVQNLINDKMSEDVPRVDYDLQNNELLCKCFKDEEQLVFNTKFNVATSIYTRQYDDIMDIKNHIYGITNDLIVRKYNYLKHDGSQVEYLSPMAIHFVINPSASVVKVFDSQQIIPIKRDQYMSRVIDNLNMKFETDLYTATRINTKDVYTDREGNIIYNIPRFANEPYGNRLRGKWMKVNITTNQPNDYTTISHVITKFRQSFS